MLYLLSLVLLFPPFCICACINSALHWHIYPHKQFCIYVQHTNFEGREDSHEAWSYVEKKKNKPCNIIKIIVVCPSFHYGRSAKTIWPWDTRPCTMTSTCLRDLPFYSSVYIASLACMQVVMWWKIIKPGAAGGEQSEFPACILFVEKRVCVVLGCFQDSQCTNSNASKEQKQNWSYPNLY